MTLKSELSPIEDRGLIFGVVAAPQGSTPQYTADQLKPIEAFYSQSPRGLRATPPSRAFRRWWTARRVLRLKPWEERAKKQQQIAEELRPKLASIPGVHGVPDQPAVARAELSLDARSST